MDNCENTQAEKAKRERNNEYDHVNSPVFDAIDLIDSLQKKLLFRTHLLVG